jgi:hypothetical protein
LSPWPGEHPPPPLNPPARPSRRGPLCEGTGAANRRGPLLGPAKLARCKIWGSGRRCRLFHRASAIRACRAPRRVLGVGKRSPRTQTGRWPCRPARPGATRAHRFLDLGFAGETLLPGRRCFERAARSMGCEMRPRLALAATSWRGARRQPVPVGALQPALASLFSRRKRRGGGRR